MADFTFSESLSGDKKELLELKLANDPAVRVTRNHEFICYIHKDDAERFESLFFQYYEQGDLNSKLPDLIKAFAYRK